MKKLHEKLENDIKFYENIRAMNPELDMDPLLLELRELEKEISLRMMDEEEGDPEDRYHR